MSIRRHENDEEDAVEASTEGEDTTGEDTAAGTFAKEQIASSDNN